MDKASQVLRQLDRGEYSSVRQASNVTDVLKSTLLRRRAGIQPRGSEDQQHARLTRYQQNILAQYIKDLQLQYAPVNQAQLHVVAQALAR